MVMGDLCRLIPFPILALSEKATTTSIGVLYVQNKIYTPILFENAAGRGTSLAVSSVRSFQRILEACSQSLARSISEHPDSHNFDVFTLTIVAKWTQGEVRIIVCRASVDVEKCVGNNGSARKTRAPCTKILVEIVCIGEDPAHVSDRRNIPCWQALIEGSCPREHLMHICDRRNIP